MPFTTTSQRAYVLEANGTAMNTTKNQQFFFLEFTKTMMSSKHNKKLIVDDKETTDQNRF